ncbi:carboxypeptidase-like regulatory domain-containing protein [Dyadobacter sp. CY345]|uniref:carboxypeptidase-like regulatory domain-containing protein n=1 Tax=Dyadobacter sp. CY345 TaxID=2909335 RepID=UPI001F33CC42|nr:carboxypeptidase-like regulatory domain-containing protein [Dyadobacter sp. CY345]MCF2443979.1 carboxypeptidase-like regulatory domain-containing protein [Dyadobacter sp. CY345]
MFSSSLFGQTFSGIIVDSQNGTPLPYANIGVKGKSIGGIADSKGHFHINISNAVLTDTIVVSYLGYANKTFVKSSLSESKYDIKLISNPLLLHEVVTRGKREIIVIGNKNPSSRYTGWGDYVSSRGRLRGVAIETKETPLQLSKFKMHLDACEFDSVRFRLHFLPIGENYSGNLKEEIIKENVFFNVVNDQKWVTVDLSRYNLVIDQNIIVAVEWVDAWVKNEIRNESYLLTISTSREAGFLYTRKTPEEPFSVTKSNATPTMFFETYKPPHNTNSAQ